MKRLIEMPLSRKTLRPLKSKSKADRSSPLLEAIENINVQLNKYQDIINKLSTSNTRLDEALQYSLQKIAHLESQLNSVLYLVDIADKRSQSLVYQSQQIQCIVDYLQISNHKKYIDNIPSAIKEKIKNLYENHQLKLLTNHPIANTSHDHIQPESTVEGLARPTDFVKDCINQLGANFTTLDLGCGAGGLSFEFILNDVFAVGLDGSDHCRNFSQGYWSVLKDNLLTCDISKPYHFVNNSETTRHKFNLITSWEVLEHISETDLNHVLTNVRNNLDDSGYFIGSISMLDYFSESGEPYHLTVKPKEWWSSKFHECGFIWPDETPFQTKYFPRGNGVRFQDFQNYSKDISAGFHFIAMLKS